MIAQITSRTAMVRILSGAIKIVIARLQDDHYDGMQIKGALFSMAHCAFVCSFTAREVAILFFLCSLTI
jgi:hypothetical protein